MKRQAITITTLLTSALMMFSSLASAGIAGITGATCGGADACFNLTARTGHIALGDGNYLLTWSYGDDDGGTGTMQYPGPTLIVNEGDTVQVSLSNTLDEPTSIVFPGQSGVVATGGTPGQMTSEIAAGAGAVVYSFVASEPGTYLYQSGSHAELQIEMGLVGALIVRPAGFNANNPTAYGAGPTAYDREYLYFLTEMDSSVHEDVELGLPVEPANIKATLWFINGRNGPDTMHPDNAGWMPLQPYGALAQMEPGERVLLRVIGAGRDMHPFHHHGNNAWQIAQDGRVLESGPGQSAPYPDFQGRPGLEPIPELANAGATLPDQSVSNYTTLTTPGNTYDLIFTWTGLGMNWDIYGNRPGHTAADCSGGARETNEDPNSHCLDLDAIVTLPEQQAMTFGGLWSGSPYMGSLDALPPDQGGLNPFGGFSFMWHSHSEKELVNDDVFPGGMMTMMIVEAPGTLD